MTQNDELFSILKVQFYNIAILEDVVSFGHHAVMFSRTPDAGILQLGSEIFVN